MSNLLCKDLVLTRYISRIYSIYIYIYMETTRVIFNVPKKVKEKAAARAKDTQDTLTSVLAHTLHLYGEGLYDPDDFLSKKDLEEISSGLADMREGRTTPLETVMKNNNLL